MINNNGSNNERSVKSKKTKLSITTNFKKIIAIAVIIFGLGFLSYGYLNNIVHFINLGIGLVLIGWIILSFSYEKYLKYDIGSGIFSDYIDLIGKLIKNLDIKTSGVVIPPRENLKNGAVFLPLNEDFKINFGLINDTIFFVNSDNKNEMGLILSPLGKSLVKTLKKYGDYEAIYCNCTEHADNNLKSEKLDNIKDYLNYSLNLFQLGNNIDINFSNNDVIILSYEIYDNTVCKKLQKEGLCKKYPCPVCGFIVLSLAKSLDRILKIEEIIEENKHIIIKLRIINEYNM
ncbi:hypothetical protein [Methanothermococcus sp.]|uniref:hypothetical protein n=1 Tax=Methanothermococcus sp. TaxID=2614238 RepID=UPI0025E855C2|nr:hypothetical protein [Methanothermococcus sp.]